MATFRIIISKGDSLDEFTTDTLVKNVADEHTALKELLDRTAATGKPFEGPIQPLKVIRPA